MAIDNTRLKRLLNFFVLCIFVLCCIFTSSVVAKAVGKDKDKSMKDVISGSGLYNKSDKVVILNATTFVSTVSGSKQAWIVEFYNSWCGHCIRYAPTWKEFAASVYGWRNVVRVAVVDCVVEANTPLCREYEIMYYPTVKFFPAHSKELGKAIEKGDSAKSLRKSLAETLVKEQQEGRGTDWPNLTPYRSGNLYNLWKDVPSNVKYAVLIFTDKESDIGVELVLELDLIPSIQARVVFSDNEVLAKAVHVLTYPSVILVDSNETTELVQSTDKSFKGLLIAIHSHLKLKGIDLPTEEENKSVEVRKDDETSSEPPYIKLAREMLQEADVAFFADMERALRYSLTHEIAGYNNIMGQAAYDYVTIIYHYFPLSAEKKQFFELLLSDMKRDSTLTGQEWKEKISRAESKVAGPVWEQWTLENSGWLGCQGSQKKYRGYPCALWTTFHTLTVNAMDTGCTKQDGASLLRAIHGYITNFFGCSDCAQHFHQMAQDSDLFANVKSCEEGVEWLWSAHNKVNHRLKDDPSTDPAYPKVDFPTEQRCGDCHNNSNWVIPNVLKYLSRVYGVRYINQLGKRYDLIEGLSPKTEAYQLVSSGWIMSPLDLSLCVVLYIASGIIIMFVWFKFLIRRSYRKKAYIHDLLGKV